MYLPREKSIIVEYMYIIFGCCREMIKEVPTKLDNYLHEKHYLHATDLVVNAGNILKIIEINN